MINEKANLSYRIFIHEYTIQINKIKLLSKRRLSPLLPTLALATGKGILPLRVGDKKKYRDPSKIKLKFDGVINF